MMDRISELTIRAMTLDDIDAVCRIDRASFPTPWPERSYRFELTRNPAAQLLVADRNGGSDGVVGYVGMWFIVDEAHISTLAVDPGCRGMGFGARLLADALTFAAGRGVRKTTLEVRVSNHAAIQLYRKFGFEIVGRRKAYYRSNQEDAHIMALNSMSAWRRSDGGGVV
jgi:ribosomal-protein-alanine N-acetyltransferase